YFTLQKKTLTVSVSPCSVTIEWSLSARALKDKPPKNPHLSSRKSMPEMWWKGLGMETIIHTYTGKAVDTYSGPAYEASSLYIVSLRSTEQDTQVTVYLQEGPRPSGAFPELPSDSQVHILGVGLTSVTVSWAPSPSIIRTSLHSKKVPYGYCVLVNLNHNYRNLCAAREEIRKALESDKKREKKDKQGKDLVLPILNAWRWQHWDTLEDRDSSAVARAPPILPPTLHLKSFNKLRSCSSVTLAWMGTEERSLYCLYQRRITDQNKENSTDHCLGPESRPATEQVLCKYFQDLDPRRAVTTAVIRGLDP
ncbi:hypothetical protein P4O66_011476, partial [Electrophorus voltai]